MKNATRSLSVAASGAFAAIRDLLAPPACLTCDSGLARHGSLCASCWSNMRFIDRPYCEVLGTPFAYDQGVGAVSPEAIADPPPFDRLRAAVLYDPLARSLVSNLKFSDRTDLAPWMAGWMATAGRELLAERPVVVPAPLHWRRLHERRYNQSAELARAVAGKAGLEYRPLALERHRHTERQVGLDALARSRNVQGAFRVPAAQRPLIEGRRVLLVDDVYTTGATVKACARALRRAGVAGVDVLVFARVPAGDI